MRIVFHIDVNSAYLSWTAAWMLENGFNKDIRKLPAVIAGDPENRHGIILAKSIPAKGYQITTGESLYEARQKCSDLLVFPPNYDLYMDCSEAMYHILREYSSLIQRYSIDECFLDYTHSACRFGDPFRTAYRIKDRIRNELGFTVNVGIGHNKLLAKMAGELRKPNMVHTIWENEIQKKLWPLPIGELYMCGRASTRKLEEINIRTIGDLANADKRHLRAMLGAHGELLWRYANGIDEEPVSLNDEIKQKGVSNSITTKADMLSEIEAKRVILGLVERVGLRLRRMGCVTDLVSVSIRSSGFNHYTHQRKLIYTTDSTSEIYQIACEIFEESWKGEAIRHVGVSVSDLSSRDIKQMCLFQKDTEREERKDQIIDAIRDKFGETAIFRATFANSNEAPLQGGTNNGNFLMMGGYKQ